MEYINGLASFIALIGAITGIITWLNSSRKRFVFVLDENINLYSEISKGISDLEISYKGQAIDEKFYLIKAFFIYQGTNDINKRDTIIPIFLETNSGGKFFDPKIIKVSPQLSVNIKNDTDKLFFEVDLMKGNEYIYFQSIFISNANNNFFLNPGHRISNVPKIENRSRYFRNIENNLLWSNWTTFLFLIVILPSDYNNILERFNESDSIMYKSILLVSIAEALIIIPTIFIFITAIFQTKRWYGTYKIFKSINLIKSKKHADLV